MMDDTFLRNTFGLALVREGVAFDEMVPGTIYCITDTAPAPGTPRMAYIARFTGIEAPNEPRTDPVASDAPLPYENWQSHQRISAVNEVPGSPDAAFVSIAPEFPKDHLFYDEHPLAPKTIISKAVWETSLQIDELAWVVEQKQRTWYRV